MLALVFLAAGALLAGVAVPLIRRRIAPNGLYGLRVPATLEDEGVWYDADAAFGRDLFALGALIAGAAVSVPLLSDVTEDEFGRALATLTVIGAVAVAVVGWRRANRLLGTAGAPRSHEGETVIVRLTRDSVAAGDDAFSPHEREVSRTTDPLVLVASLHPGYLPSVAGTGHSWGCDLNGRRIARVYGNAADARSEVREVQLEDVNHVHFSYTAAYR